MANKSPATSFKKGKSGNPKGRPIGSGELIKRRNEYLSILMDKSDWGKAIEKLNKEVEAGNIQAIKFLGDHMLPKQGIKTEEEEPTTSIEVVEVMKELHGKIPIEYIEAMLGALKNIEEKKRLSIHQIDTSPGTSMQNTRH